MTWLHGFLLRLRNLESEKDNHIYKNILTKQTSRCSSMVELKLFRNTVSLFLMEFYLEAKIHYISKWFRTKWTRTCERNQECGLCTREDAENCFPENQYMYVKHCPRHHGTKVKHKRVCMVPLQARMSYHCHILPSQRRQRNKPLQFRQRLNVLLISNVIPAVTSLKFLSLYLRLYYQMCPSYFWNGSVIFEINLVPVSLWPSDLETVPLLIRAPFFSKWRFHRLVSKTAIGNEGVVDSVCPSFNWSVISSSHNWNSNTEPVIK